ncbi:MAG: glycosyltransferase family 4 protein, partial [Actinomycetota bacterium]
DLVLFGTPWPLLLLGPRLKRRGFRYASLVYGAETLLPSALPGLREALARALAEADLLLVISQFTAGALRSLLEGKGRACPPIGLLRAQIDLHRFHPGSGGPAARRALGVPPEAKVVLCFGRLVRRKGVHRLIEALPAIKQHVPEAALVVAGTGPEERRLRRLAGNAGPVYFAGPVPEERAPGVYAAADVFVLPVADRWFGFEVEGLGVVLLEAAASGVPCIAGRSGGSPEAVRDGETGFVVDATDPDELVGRITWLLEDPDRGRDMGRAGRSFVENEFSALKPPTALLEWLA